VLSSAVIKYSVPSSTSHVLSFRTERSVYVLVHPSAITQANDNGFQLDAVDDDQMKIGERCCERRTTKQGGRVAHHEQKGKSEVLCTIYTHHVP
jgi:hypothetical protein